MENERKRGKPRRGGRPKDYGAIFIYGLVDPRDGTIRYVGKAKDPHWRHRQHVLDTCIGHHRGRWLQLLRTLNLEPGIVILEAVRHCVWRRAERKWILALRAKGFRLVNGTDGGDGLPAGYLRAPTTEEGMLRSHLTQSIQWAKKKAPDREWAFSFLPFAMACRGLMGAVTWAQGKWHLRAGFDPSEFRAARYYASLLADAHRRRYPKEGASHWKTPNQVCFPTSPAPTSA